MFGTLRPAPPPTEPSIPADRANSVRARQACAWAKARLVSVLPTAALLRGALRWAVPWPGLLTLPAASPATAASNVLIVYVYADDCAPCQIFAAQDWPQFLASPVSKSVKFIKTHAPKTTQVTCPVLSDQF